MVIPENIRVKSEKKRQQKNKTREKGRGEEKGMRRGERGKQEKMRIKAIQYISHSADFPSRVVCKCQRAPSFSNQQHIL